jgi:hypothetical protein
MIWRRYDRQAIFFAAIFVLTPILPGRWGKILEKDLRGALRSAEK